MADYHSALQKHKRIHFFCCSSSFCDKVTFATTNEMSLVKVLSYHLQQSTQNHFSLMLFSSSCLLAIHFLKSSPYPTKYGSFKDIS